MPKASLGIRIGRTAGTTQWMWCLVALNWHPLAVLGPLITTSFGWVVHLLLPLLSRRPMTCLLCQRLWSDIERIHLEYHVFWLDCNISLFIKGRLFVFN